MNARYLKIRNFFLQDENLYSDKKSKKEKFLDAMLYLDSYHRKNCKEYGIIANLLKKNINQISDLNFMPVDLFKKFNLFSISNKDIIKKLTSSGTSNNLSKIFLDKNNALAQSRVLQKILFKNFGKEKKPIIFLESLEKNKENLSAKKAAILGFSLLASKKYFPFNKSGELDCNIINQIINRHKDEEIIIFGFTYTIWNTFLNQNKIKCNLSNASIIHGGGWKKMESKKISPDNFKRKLINQYKFKNIINYYGMIEQVGSIFFECKMGYFHTTSFSDILIRNNMLNKNSDKKTGLVQLLSILPTSYPGHSILTQDLGAVFGEDNCKCNLKGKFFKIFGRAKKAEIRGCSNV